MFLWKSEVERSRGAFRIPLIIFFTINRRLLYIVSITLVFECYPIHLLLYLANDGIYKTKKRRDIYDTGETKG